MNTFPKFGNWTAVLNQAWRLNLVRGHGRATWLSTPRCPRSQSSHHDALATRSAAASQKTALERWRLATCVANLRALCDAPLGKRRACCPPRVVVRRPGRPIGGYYILVKLFQKVFMFYCALELYIPSYTASSNRASVFPVPRIC
jgi:hypothetical protein